jgi:hypothetical protein
MSALGKTAGWVRQAIGALFLFVKILNDIIALLQGHGSR